MNIFFSRGIIIFIFFLCSIFQFTTCFSQSFYLKTGGSYNLPLHTTEMPEYFTFFYNVPVSGIGERSVELSTSEFSVAKGVNYDVGAGWKINESFSVELALKYFSNTKKKFVPDKYVGNPNATVSTYWNYGNIYLSPTLLLGHTLEKSRINVFLTPGIGYGNLKIKASDLNQYNHYSFKPALALSFGFGFEFMYKLTSLTHGFIAIGNNNIYYTPKYSKIFKSSTSLENLAVWEKEINYVKELNQNMVLYDQQIVDYGQPVQRLKQSLKTNSIYIGIGIKYAILKNGQS